MQIVFINGRQVQADWRELQAMLAHPATLAVFLSGILAYRLLPVSADIPALSPRLEVLFWAHVLILYNAVYLGTAALLGRLGRRLWTPALQGLIAGILTLSGTAFFVWAGVPPSDAFVLVQFWLFLWALLLFFELLFVTFVLDLVRPGAPSAVAAAGRRRNRVVFVTGRTRYLRFRDVCRVLLHPATVGLTLAVVAGMAALHPHDAVRDLPLHLATQFWVKVLVLSYAGFIGMAWLSWRLGIAFVVPLALLILSILLTLTSGGFLSVATGSIATRDEIVGYTVFHWSVLVLVEFLIVTFALDRILREAEGRTAAAPAVAPRAAEGPPPRPDTANPPPAADRPVMPQAPPPAPPAETRPERPARLCLQGVEVPAAEILAIDAEEHYLRIVTDERTRLLRGRMADVEAQMPPDLGLRVHRSHWVAARAVVALRRTEGGWILELVGGREVPVARGRQARVRAWVAALPPR